MTANTNIYPSLEKLALNNSFDSVPSAPPPEDDVLLPYMLSRGKPIVPYREGVSAPLYPTNHYTIPVHAQPPQPPLPPIFLPQSSEPLTYRPIPSSRTSLDSASSDSSLRSYRSDVFSSAFESVPPNERTAYARVENSQYHQPPHYSNHYQHSHGHRVRNGSVESDYSNGDPVVLSATDSYISVNHTSNSGLGTNQSSAPSAQKEAPVVAATANTSATSSAPPIGFIYENKDLTNGGPAQGSSGEGTPPYPSSKTNGLQVARLFPDSESNSEETPLPPNLSLLWESSSEMQLYFVQMEGHVVKTHKPLQLTAYKYPVDTNGYSKRKSSDRFRDSTLLLFQKNTWRLGLSRGRSRILMGKQSELVVLDDSTEPARTAVLVLPKDMRSQELQRLEVLLKASADLQREPTSLVEKAESGLESGYSSVTGGLSKLMKESTPGVHKSTKWARKGTGSIVRLGGSLVSKGVHLVADQVVDKDKPPDFSAEHKKLLDDLATYRKAVQSDSVTTV